MESGKALKLSRLHENRDVRWIRIEKVSDAILSQRACSEINTQESEKKVKRRMIGKWYNENVDIKTSREYSDKVENQTEN